MAPNLWLYQLLLVALVLICLLIHVGWLDNSSAIPQRLHQADQTLTQALQSTSALHRTHPQTSLPRL